jgi:hypothetical protein
VRAGRGAVHRLRAVACGLTAGAVLLAGCSSTEGPPELTEPVGDPPVGFATETSSPGTPGSPADVDVQISYGAVDAATNAVEVGGIVTGVVEDDGRCALVLRRPGQTDVRVEGAAVPDVTSTACARLAAPVDGLAPGTWTAQLEYRSGASAGTSAELPIEIP